MMPDRMNAEENHGNDVFNSYEESFFSLTSFITISYFIESGMNNTILVPSSIFTNSYFYKHEILDGNGNETWANLTFYANDSSAENTTAHVSGVIAGNLTGDEVLELLTELSKNTTGAVTYNYSLEDPTQLNLPPDTLRLVPFSGYVKKLDGKTVLLKNDWTSEIQQPPTTSANGGYNTVNGWLDLIKKKVQGVVNVAISVGTAVWEKAVELGTELAHVVCSAITAVYTSFTELVEELGKAIINFGMKVIGAFETALNEVKAAVEKVVDVIGALIDWIKEEIEEAVNKFIKSIKEDIDREKIGNLVRQTALDIDSSNGDTTGENVGTDIIKIMEYLIGISSMVLTGIAIFAAAELLWYAVSEGIGAVVSEIVAGMLKNVVLSLLLTAVTVETMNEVSEKTGHGIDNSVVRALLKMFSLSAEFTGMVWDLYKVLVEKAEKGRLYFYIGLAVAIGAFIASTVGETLEMSDNILKAYDAIVCGISITGLSLMYSDREHDVERVLPLTSLLEWSVGWAGVISAFVKLSADAANGFGGGDVIEQEYFQR